MSMKVTKLYTVTEVAEYMRVHRVTVLRWIKDGRIGAKKVGKRGDYRIPVEEIDKILK